MRSYKHIQFGEGIQSSLTDFKKTYAAHLKGLSDSEVKEAHKVATKGNAKLSNSISKRKKTDESES